MIKYYLAALSAFITWGFFSLILKPLHNYASLDILFYRIFFCVVIMLIINVFFRNKILKENIQKFKTLTKNKKKQFLILNISGGILLSANWFFFIFAMNHISVRSTSLAYLICPILTTILAYVFLKEKLKKIQWLAIIISTIACLILSFNHLIDLAISIIVGLTYALYLISQKKNKGFDKLILLAFHILCSAIILLPFYPNFSQAVPTDIIFYLYILVIAVVFTIIPLFLNLYALKGINSSTVGMLLNINPIIAFVLSIVWWHEKIDVLQVFAYSLIFISVILFNIKKPKKKLLIV